jgi:Ran GTPase-activating protein (RanGAP) involved in mRNA processing and transport
LYEELSTTLAEGLSANSALEELSLILSTSDTNAIDTLARGIQGNSKLKSLKLNRCSLEDGQVAALIKALENHPSLRELSVQGSSCRAMGIVAISGLLQSDNKKPFKLDLSNQHFTRNNPFGISFLAPALPENKSMRFLDLSSNHLTDVEVTCIASALIENSALEELKLVNCNVTDKGTKIIAKHLPLMTGLKTLWLQDNPLGEEGALSLFEASRTNMHLEQLILPKGRGRAMDDIQRKIDYFLALNKGGRRLLGNPNQVALGLWPRVLDRANSLSWDSFSVENAQASVIYCLIRNGPALFGR